jgi:hypothetical protein
MRNDNKNVSFFFRKGGTGLYRVSVRDDEEETGSQSEKLEDHDRGREARSANRVRYCV